MAMTEYIVFMRYYNDTVGKCVTNNTSCEWYQCETKEYNGHELNRYITLEDMNQYKLDKGDECLENLFISPLSTDTSFNTDQYEKLVINGLNVNNPKYDMIFIWDGLGYFKFDNEKIPNVTTNADDSKSILYYDKMKRVRFTPWFFYEKFHSLRAAMLRANTLIDLFGKDNVLVGKNVPLSQYIDIT